MLYILETCQKRTFPQPPPKTQKAIVDKLSKFYSQMQTGKYFLYLYKIWTKNNGTHFIPLELQTFLNYLKILSNQGHVSSICTSKWQMCVLSNKYIKCDKGQMVPINQRFDILLDSLFMIYLSLHSLAIYCSKMSEIALL